MVEEPASVSVAEGDVEVSSELGVLDFVSLADVLDSVSLAEVLEPVSLAEELDWVSPADVDEVPVAVCVAEVELGPSEKVSDEDGDICVASGVVDVSTSLVLELVGKIQVVGNTQVSVLVSEALSLSVAEVSEDQYSVDDGSTGVNVVQ